MFPIQELSSTDSVFQSRQLILARILQRAGISALVLNPGPSLAYLTGLQFHTSERPVIAIFTTNAPVVVFLPRLEGRKVDGLSYKVRVFSYEEDPASWAGVLREAVQVAEIDRQVVGVEPTRLRFLELRLLEEVAPSSQFSSAEDCLAQLRMQKDAGELAAMRQAVTIAQEALRRLVPSIRPGVTERQLSSELILHLLRLGSDPELPFAPIVSGGPHSANPHAVPSDRPLQAGDLLVIDWGAAHAGYCSDLTRTFAIGSIEPEFTHIAEVVEAANQAGRAVVKPGVTCESVDLAARRVIEQAGYGAYFTHRTGHGLGMEGHEPPYIRSGNLSRLEPGMTFTIEPGIYLPERGGVRIEDNVVVTEQGSECLSDNPRSIAVIGG